MANWREANGGSGWRGFKLETRFEWRTTMICTRAYLIFKYINDLKGGVTSTIFKFADDTNIFRKQVGKWG